MVIFEKPAGLLSKLKGKRTYICSIALFVLGGAFSLGWVDYDTFLTWSAMIAGLGGIALRSAIATIK